MSPTAPPAPLRPLALLLLAGLGLTACGPGASRPEAMAPTLTAPTTQHQAGALHVQAVGGCEDCAPGQARLSAAQFRDAAVLALRQAGQFKPVLTEGAADYALELRIFRVDIPMMGFDMRCTMEAGWTLIRPGATAPVWQQAIETRHLATVGDAFAGVERVRLCWEGAARANIAEGIARLARLPLPPG